MVANAPSSTLPSETVARGAAERYIAELVASCSDVASFFEDVPCAVCSQLSWSAGSTRCSSGSGSGRVHSQEAALPGPPHYEGSEATEDHLSRGGSICSGASPVKRWRSVFLGPLIEVSSQPGVLEAEAARQPLAPEPPSTSRPGELQSPVSRRLTTHTSSCTSANSQEERYGSGETNRRGSSESRPSTLSKCDSVPSSCGERSPAKQGVLSTQRSCTSHTLGDLSDLLPVLSQEAKSPSAPMSPPTPGRPSRVRRGTLPQHCLLNKKTFKSPWVPARLQRPKGPPPRSSANKAGKGASRPSVVGLPHLRSTEARTDASTIDESDRSKTTIDDEFVDGVKTRLSDTKRKHMYAGAVTEEVKNLEELSKLIKLAYELNMSLDDVRLVKSIFDTYDDDGSGSLEPDEFEQLVTTLLEHNFTDGNEARDRAKAFAGWCWWETNGTDGDRPATIGFHDFLKWYSSNGFKEDMLLSDTERHLRKLAKDNDISANYVDSIKHAFDSFDTDKSGAVDISEFRQVLHRVLRMPPHTELPWSRVQYFWSEIDADGSGTVVFEEFLQWYVKYTVDKNDRMPYDDFYKGIRRMGRNYLDPPPYPVEAAAEGG